MQTIEIKTLKDLDIGDVFVHANDRQRNVERFIVCGKPVFNPRHGSPTRDCMTKSGKILSKSCRLQVIKKGVSVDADRIRELFNK